MYKCNFCGREFEKFQSKGAHIIACKRNPKYNEFKELKICSLRKWKKEKFVKQHGVLVNKNKICCNCKKIFLIKEFEYDNKEKYFCSTVCSHSYSTKENRMKINEKISISMTGKEFTEREYRKCPICKENFRIKKTLLNQTCGNKKCINELIKLKNKGKTGGYREGGGRCKGEW